MNKALNELSLCQMLLQINAGKVSAEQMINACFERIDEREPVVQAWQYRLDRDAYLAHYHQHQAFYDASLLKGLPVGIKDIIDTKHMPTEMGSIQHQGRQPVDDASCVALIQQAGGMVLGKTVTTEFAYFKPGKTCNPADLTRTPGGSSSGSAAAVADGMVPVAFGSQTAASVIRPAAYCGAVGYVGSRGEYSLRGVQPLSQSLDSLGLFARYVEDIELLRSILLRQPQVQSLSQKPSKILLCHGQLIGETSAAMQQAMTSLSDRLAAQGVELIELEAESSLQDMVDYHGQIMAWEVARNLAVESFDKDSLSQPLQDLIETGVAMSRETYLAALQAVESYREVLWQTYSDVDAILAPAAPDIAPLGHDKTGSPHMSRPWQAMGLPVVTLPGLKDQAGLPLGIQLVGRVREDDGLLQVAKWLQAQM